MKIIYGLFFLICSNLLSQDLNDSLLLHYSFNGNVNDTSVNDNHGVNFGANFGDDRLGNPNSAIYFDGLNDYVNFPNISELKPSLPVSFSFWIKYESVSLNDREVFNTSFEEDRNTGVFFNSQGSTGNYAVNYGDGSNSYVSSTRRTFVVNEAIEINNWHHVIVIVNSATNMEIYIDCINNGGAYSGTGGTLQYSGTPGCIGRHDRVLGSPANYFKGAIDDFRYWDRALTDDNIAELLGVNYTLFNSTDPSGCGIDDGSITISDLNASSDYTIAYNTSSGSGTISVTSNASGEIILSGLASGTYDSIVVTEDATGCTDNLGQVELSAPALMAIIDSTSPSGCGIDDGSITISSLTSNVNYTITYNYEGTPISIMQVSDGSGIIDFIGLPSGMYDTIVVTEDSSGCTDNLRQVELSASPLIAILDSVNPTSCGIDDGTITISSLNANVNYIITYNYEGTPISIMRVSDGSGIIEITGLPIGIYDTTVVTEDSTDCTNNFDLLELTCFDDNLNCFKTKNFFTPNDDGFNDFWSLEVESNTCDYVLYIFDRYGKLLKTLTPTNDKWDGAFNGKRMPSDDYWYLVEYEFNGKSLRHSSHFALKR